MVRLVSPPYRNLLRFNNTAAAIGNYNRPALIIAMQQLAAAEPWTTSGSAAGRWLAKQMGPREAPRPLNLDGDALLKELFDSL